MSAPTAPADAKAAKVLARLHQASAALRELLALLPEPVHKMAIEMATYGALYSPPPDTVADTARLLVQYADSARRRAAPVFHLAAKRPA